MTVGILKVKSSGVGVGGVIQGYLYRSGIGWSGGGDGVIGWGENVMLTSRAASLLL